MTAETFDAVLAEMRTTYARIRFMEPINELHNQWADRLAAAHTAALLKAADVLQAERLEHTRVDAATALLRECLQFVPSNLAARVAGMVGRE